VRRQHSTASGLLAALVLLLLAGCGGPDLPDPGDSAVKAERERVRELLRHGTWLSGAADCDLQVLRQEGATTWVWAHCESLDGGHQQGFAGPVRIDGEAVRLVGEPYEESLRDLFPEDLADLVITTDDSDYTLG
jgi:hypothetical protein